jgi:hypothetical protein
VEETGRNSVIPSMIPKMITSTHSGIPNETRNHRGLASDNLLSRRRPGLFGGNQDGWTRRRLTANRTAESLRSGFG